MEPRNRVQRLGRRGVSVRPGRRRGQWMLCGWSGSAGRRGWRPESAHKCSFSRGRDNHCLGDVFTVPLWSWLNKLMFISELPLPDKYLLIFRKCVKEMTFEKQPQWTPSLVIVLLCSLNPAALIPYFLSIGQKRWLAWFILLNTRI